LRTTKRLDAYDPRCSGKAVVGNMMPVGKKCSTAVFVKEPQQARSAAGSVAHNPDQPEPVWTAQNCRHFFCAPARKPLLK
jgi:hypothetical protein